MELYLNPNIFFLFTQRGVVLWDFKSHQQYSLDFAHITRLLEIVEEREFDATANQIDAVMLHAGIISDSAFEAEEWGWDQLSKIFHVGTKDIPQECIPETKAEWAIKNLDVCVRTIRNPVPGDKIYELINVVKLPSPEISSLEKLSLWQTLISRRTCRTYLEKKISKEMISTILYSSLGFLKERESGINAFVPDCLRQRRSSPSGGGLNATEAYIFALKIEGIKPGIYHYDSKNHQLDYLSAIEDPSILGTLLMGQCFSNDLAFGIFLTSRFDRLWWKYPHSRAYRVALLEIGHISQVLQLTTTALGLNTWLSGAFKDSQVEEVLCLKNCTEQPILFVGGGYSNGDDIDSETRKILSDNSKKK